MTNYKTFGVVLNKLSIEQKDICIINELNKMVENDDRLCPIVFFIEQSRLFKVPLFARMPLEELYSFSNPVIANDIETANILNKNLCPNRKLYYLWDLEWIYDDNFNFNKYAQIYNEFEIIVRNKSHYDLFSKVWKTPDHLIEDFNYEQVRNLFNA